jgi:cyanophycinase
MLEGQRPVLVVALVMMALAVSAERPAPALPSTTHSTTIDSATIASADVDPSVDPTLGVPPPDDPFAMPADMRSIPEVVPSTEVAPPPVKRVPPRRPRKRGTIFAHGGGPDAALEQFAALCEDGGPLVLIPTANEDSDREAHRDRLRQPWLRRGLRDVVVLHARDREEALLDGFAEPLRAASCAWMVGGRQGRLEDRYVGTPVERELHALLRRGGAVGGSSAGSAIMSRVMIHHGNPEPVEGTGFGILPGIIVDQHFLARQREPRLQTMLARHPDLVGFGIDEATALVVQGDRWRVVGDSVVRRCTLETGCADLPAGASGRFPGPPE